MATITSGFCSTGGCPLWPTKDISYVRIPVGAVQRSFYQQGVGSKSCSGMGSSQERFARDLRAEGYCCSMECVVAPGTTSAVYPLNPSIRWLIVSVAMIFFPTHRQTPSAATPEKKSGFTATPLHNDQSAYQYNSCSSIPLL